MAKNFIQGAIKHKGALTRYAKAHKTTVGKLEAHMPKGASTTLKRQINLAKTLNRLRPK